MQPLIVTAVFYLAIAVLCLLRPNAGRIVTGLFFWVMAIAVHGYFIVASPQGYRDFASDIQIGLFRDAAVWVVDLSPRGFGVFMFALELAIGALLLSRAGWVRLGLIAAIAFLVGIAPLTTLTLANLILAAALVYLLRQEFDTSLWQTVERKVTAGKSQPVST